METSLLVLSEGAGKTLGFHATVWDWLIMTVLVPLLCIVVDMIANRSMRPPTIKKAAILSAMWIGVSLIVGAAVFFRFGAEASAQYYSGYIAEKGLSFDNVFAWSILFLQFKLYRGYHARLMLSGIIMSIILRVILMLGIGAMLEAFWFITVILFVALFALAAKLIFGSETEPDENDDPTQGKTYKRLARSLDIAEDTYATSYTTTQEGRGKIRLGRFTVLSLPFKLTFFAIVALILFGTNTMFSFDSLPVVMAVSNHPFLIITPNIMGLLGLTSLYFLYDAISDKFHRLGTVLPYVLVFMGLKGAVGFDWHHFGLPFSGYELSPMIGVAVILGIVAFGIVWSMVSPPKPEAQHEPVTMDKDLDEVQVA